VCRVDGGESFVSIGLKRRELTSPFSHFLFAE
jgi:hypothetical protein